MIAPSARRTASIPGSLPSKLRGVQPPKAG